MRKWKLNQTLLSTFQNVSSRKVVRVSPETGDEQNGGVTDSSDQDQKFREALEDFSQSLQYPSHVEWVEANSKWKIEVEIPEEAFMEGWDESSQRLSTYLEKQDLENRRSDVFVRARPSDGDASPSSDNPPSEGGEDAKTVECLECGTELEYDADRDEDICPFCEGDSSRLSREYEGKSGSEIVDEVKDKSAIGESSSCIKCGKSSEEAEKEFRTGRWSSGDNFLCKECVMPESEQSEDETTESTMVGGEPPNSVKPDAVRWKLPNSQRPEKWHYASDPQYGSAVDKPRELLFSAATIQEFYEFKELLNQLAIAHRHMDEHDIDGHARKINERLQRKLEAEVFDPDV